MKTKIFSVWVKYSNDAILYELYFFLVICFELSRGFRNAFRETNGSDKLVWSTSNISANIMHIDFCRCYWHSQL